MQMKTEMMKSRMRPTAAAMPAMAGVDRPALAESGSDEGVGLSVPEADGDERVEAARVGVGFGVRLAGAEVAVGLGRGLTDEVSMAVSRSEVDQWNGSDGDEEQ